MTLEELRNEIDKLDDSLLEILNKRMEVVRKVGELKKHSNTIVYRPEREKSILDRLALQSKGLMNRPALEAIYLEIFAVARNLELPERIAYLGPEGTFTHQAAESRFGAMSDYLQLPNIRSVFESVDTGRARFGVVPIENNQEGIVKETIDLLYETDLKIVSEIVMPIHFALASQNEKLSEITKIYSKEQPNQEAIGHLKNYFKYKKRSRNCTWVGVIAGFGGLGLSVYSLVNLENFLLSDIGNGIAITGGLIFFAGFPASFKSMKHFGKANTLASQTSKFEVKPSFASNKQGNHIGLNIRF